MIQFRINPNLDLDALARAYAADGRVRVYSLLANDDADALLADLVAREDWWQLINTEDDVIELDRAARARMSARRKAALDDEVFRRASTGFQYRYEALRVPEDEDERDERDDALTDFASLMSSEPMLAVLRVITGCEDISFSDGHATCYGPGDFLTCHDDDVAGKDRRAAYVFGLTRNWRPEWGGLLLFHEDGERTVAGHVPRFNTLDLFSVPQPHSVSLVSPAAPTRRYAVTGWLRAEL